MPEDPEAHRRQVALFRFAIISDLDIEALPRGERSARLAELATRTYRVPEGGERRFSVRTLWAWWSAYRDHGLDGLLPQPRQDRGTPRVLTPDLLEAAIALRREVAARSTATLIHILETQQRVVPGQLHRATLDRHLAEAGASRRRLKTLGDKRYIRLLFERPNQLWIGDYHEAPLLWDPAHERYRTLHLCAFLDHYSKLVPRGAWYRSEQIATLEHCFKHAVLTRGCPDGVYVDHGAAYRADQFAFACAHLGIKLRHSTPYVSEGRGAIERWNRTVAEQFEPEIRALRLPDAREIQLRFEAWLEQRYHLTVHEATGQTPLDRFAQPDFTPPRYPDPVLVAETFRVRVRRKVHAKTVTVEAAGVPFVVEPHLRGRWVEVHYDPHDLSDVLIYRHGQRQQRALPQRPNEPPRPRPERPTVTPPAFDYLGALRAAYARRVVAEARRAAEDPPAVVVQRLAALAAARDHALAALPVAVIVEAGLRLPEGLERLAATVAQQQARLLILDPLIRVHRADENSAAEMAVVLDGVRGLARATDCAVLLVHHTRKAAAGGIAGHALRGSSDLHAFGDPNLYLRRLASDGPLELRIEHRAAPGPPPLRVQLRTDETALMPWARFMCEEGGGGADPLQERTLALVRGASAPVSSAALRTALGVRKQTLLALLQRLAGEGVLRRVGREGWRLAHAVPGPTPTPRTGNPD